MSAQPTIRQEAWRYADPAALATYKAPAEPPVQTISKNQVVVETAGEGASVSAFDVQPGAHLTHIRLVMGEVAQPCFLNTHVNVQGDATYTNIFINFAATYVRNQAQVELVDKGAHANMLGAYMLDTGGHSDTLTRVHHAAPDTTSDEVYKGVLNNRARGVFQAQIRVAPDAQRIVGNQMHRALMLSDEARVDAKPELEIFADDVQCSHGATVGDLDPNQLFYLTARGIPKSVARALLIRAYLDEIIGALPEIQQASVQEQLETYLRGL